MKRILIVEDDNLLNKTLAYNLTSDGYEVTGALNARTATTKLTSMEYDLVLLDLNLPDGNGYDLCKLIKPEHPDTVVIFLTANDQEDTLLTRSVTDQEQIDFLQGIRSQIDKLDFLFQALVKTSRLETGAIRLEKKDCLLFYTLAQAMSGIVYSAEKKDIIVTVDCPEDLYLSHDSKWTAEALFNLLDNAEKYTLTGGRIRVSV